MPRQGSNAGTCGRHSTAISVAPHCSLGLPLAYGKNYTHLFVVRNLDLFLSGMPQERGGDPRFKAFFFR